jgi:histidinol-phosphatase (PHP family)
MRVDYHMHLRGPGPGDGSEGPIELRAEAVEPFVEQARERGVDEIGFTEHMYYFRQLEHLVEHPYQRSRIGHDLDDYVAALVEAKRRGLPVKVGIEVDWLPGRAAELSELLAPYPWDFLLGSVHIVDRQAVDMEPGLWADRPVEEVWRRYFAELGLLAGSGLVDVLSHPDLVKIFGMAPGPEVVDELQRDAAEAFAAGGVAIEISTAGLRKRVGEIYPSPAFLTRCRERDVPITLASDAHVAEDVGRDFPAAVELAQKAGYENVTVFAGRSRRQEPLS